MGSPVASTLMEAMEGCQHTNGRGTQSPLTAVRRTFMETRGFFPCPIWLGLAVCLPVSVSGHQISFLRANAIVRPDKLEVVLNVMPEDVLLSAGTVNIVLGRLAKADLMKGVNVHPTYLLDGLVIVDEDGHRLNGKVTGVDVPPMPGDSILLDDLMATTIVYRIEFPLAKQPTKLSFRQHFNLAMIPMPVVTLLTVTREGLNSSTMMQVPDGDNPETVAFDWTEISTSSTGTVTT